MHIQIRGLSFAIIRSPTKLLPAWYRVLAALGIDPEKMPRDVPTRWNSTYLLLVYVVERKDAVNELTDERANGMRKYYLSEEEWVMLTQLRDVLKVRRHDISILGTYRHKLSATCRCRQSR